MLDQYLSIVEQISSLNMLVIGDVMLDTYWTGNVKRISPEAPVPVVECKNIEHRLGGAANVALNLATIGIKTQLVSVVGDDLNGTILEENIQNIPSASTFFIRDSQRVTTQKIRIVAHNQQMLRVDNENIDPVSIDIEDKIIILLTPLIAKADGIIIEDYNKGLLTPKIIEKSIAIANQFRKPSFVDPKKTNFNCFKNVTLFKPNLKEICEGLALNESDFNKQSFIDAITAFMNKQNITYVLLTLSENGIMWIDKNGNKQLIAAHKRSITDVSGAGDTVVSVAASVFTLTNDINTAAVLSNLAGGLVCEKPGVVPIHKIELTNEIKRLF